MYHARHDHHHTVFVDGRECQELVTTRRSRAETASDIIRLLRKGKGVLLVFITCPVTGRPINTGVSMDRKEFEAPAQAAHETGCPHCGQTHAWTKENARLKNI